MAIENRFIFLMKETLIWRTHQWVPVIFFTMNIKEQFLITEDEHADDCIYVKIRQIGDDGVPSVESHRNNRLVGKYLLGPDEFEYIIRWAKVDEAKEGKFSVETSTASIYLGQGGAKIEKQGKKDLTTFAKTLRKNNFVAYVEEGFSNPQLIIRDYLEKSTNCGKSS